MYMAKEDYYYMTTEPGRAGLDKANQRFAKKLMIYDQVVILIGVKLIITPHIQFNANRGIICS